MASSLPIFPSRLAYGLSGGPDYPVEIITLASGHERRNRRRSAARRRYVIPGTTRPISEARMLVKFFEARDGASEVFLFRDPFFHATDHGSVISENDVVLGTGDGTNRRFAFSIPGASSQVYPIESSLLVALDGVVKNDGFALDERGRDLIFDHPPAQGVVVSVGFEFHVLVRFENSHLSITHEADGAVRHDDIILQEVLQ